MAYALEHARFSSWECVEHERLDCESLGASVNILDVSM